MVKRDALLFHPRKKRRKKTKIAALLILKFLFVLLKQSEPVDESSVKKMILTFEKRSYKNQELRIKFPDNPEK